MANVEGFVKLAAQLSGYRAKMSSSPQVSVLVGYTAKYALFVHENVEMKWRGFPRDRSIRKGRGDDIAYTGYSASKRKGLFWGPHGQAKFLEAPARTLDSSGELGRIVLEALLKKKNIGQALLLAGLRIQRESQKLVPIEFGLLRASAFTVLEQSTGG